MAQINGTPYSPGQRVNVLGGGLGAPALHPATVERVRRCMLPLPAGYVPVRYDDGETGLLVHADRLVAA